jgi:hypothetical protein
MKKLEYKKYYHLIYKRRNGDLTLQPSTIDYDDSMCHAEDMCECMIFCGFYDSCLNVEKAWNTIKEFEGQEFTWKDVVEINGKHYAEEFPISGLMDSEDVYQIDDFLESVGRKYNVYPGNIKTYMMDGIAFDSKEVEFGAESCGCYINGIPEECYE